MSKELYRRFLHPGANDKNVTHEPSNPPSPQQLADRRNQHTEIFVEALHIYETKGTDRFGNELKPDKLEERISFLREKIQVYLYESGRLMDPAVVELAENSLSANN